MTHTYKKIKISMEGYTVQMLDGDKKVGVANVFFLENPNRGKRWALLEDVMVEPNYRGQGIGNTLVKEIIQTAKDEGCYKIIAASRFSRENVHRWYEKMGFEKHGYDFRMNFEELEPQN